MFNTRSTCGPDIRSFKRGRDDAEIDKIRDRAEGLGRIGMPQIRRLMSEPQLTVAVVSLGTLAEVGGVLDDLQAAGFTVQGPRWRR